MVDFKKKKKKAPARVTPKFQAPAGYESQTNDLAGFCDPELGPVHIIPRYAKLVDSKLDAHKPSMLIVAELFDEKSSLADGVVCKKGELVGLWAKPGMSALKNLADVPVFMFQQGEIDTGKVNPMKQYQIFAKSKGRELRVTEDYRKESKSAPSPLKLEGNTLPATRFDERVTGPGVSSDPFDGLEDPTEAGL